MAEPGDRKTLEIYLNDHLAGATSALELMDDIIEGEADTPLVTFLRGLRSEVEEDLRTLEQVAAALRVQRERVKQLLADLGESLSRAKLARAGAPAELSLLLDLETLSVGIWGKTRLWRALAAADVVGDDLHAVDLDELEVRGRRQLEQVEEHRLRIATRALAG